MAVDLLGALDKFRNLSDQETDLAFFKTKVPSVAPEAYLNIVYKAAPLQVRAELEEELQLPISLVEFYREWNGARFFVGALSIYGCVARNYLLYRTIPLKLPPFNLREVNREFSHRTSTRNFICIGSYSYDRSIVCMNRETQAIVCFVADRFEVERRSWPSLDQWLSDEITRLSLFFDECGNQLVPDERLLPGTDPRPVN